MLVAAAAAMSILAVLWPPGAVSEAVLGVMPRVVLGVLPVLMLEAVPGILGAILGMVPGVKPGRVPGLRSESMLGVLPSTAFGVKPGAVFVDLKPAGSCNGVLKDPRGLKSTLLLETTVLLHWPVAC